MHYFVYECYDIENIISYVFVLFEIVDMSDGVATYYYE